jgi:hypothetical protein
VPVKRRGRLERLRRYRLKRKESNGFPPIGDGDRAIESFARRGRVDGTPGHFGQRARLSVASGSGMNE